MITAIFFSPSFSSRGAASTSEGRWQVLQVGVKAPGMPTKSDMPLEAAIASACGVDFAALGAARARQEAFQSLFCF